MNRLPRSGATRFVLPPPGRALLLALCLLVPLVAGADVFNPEPKRAAPSVPVGDKAYVLLDQGPLEYRLVGSGRLYGFARVGFGPDDGDTKSAALVIEGLHGRTLRLPLEFERSRSSRWGDGHPSGISKGRKFEVFVPNGAWNITVQAEAPIGTRVAAVLYYDGPSQDTEVAVKSPWKFRNSFGLEVIYDDNVTTGHNDAEEDWTQDIWVGPYGEGGWADDDNSERYRLNTWDDVIVAPKLDVSAERQFWDLGKTRFRTKVKRWMYTQNPIKTNTDLDFYIRQYFGKKKSLELYLHYAPLQYIRQLGDGSVYGQLESKPKEFRFTRNVAHLNWRHTVNKKLNYSVLFETNLRYYNEPFVENDVECWEVRGVVGYKVHKRLKLQFDYSYEDASGRGLDTVEETIENSDDGNSGYERDLYRFGFSWTTPWLPQIDSITGSYLFMDYYYTTDRNIFDQPFQVGRRDKNTKVTVQLNHKVNRALSVYGTFRYSERKVESPWYGDITLDKDYFQHRYWVGMTYKF